MDRPWLGFYDPGVPHSLDYPFTPLDEALRRSAERRPGSVATLFGGALGSRFMAARLTYAELNAQVDRFASAILRSGVRPGDRVAIFLPNCPQYVIAFYGTLRAGAVAVPCNPMYVAREVEHQVADSGAETIVCLTAFYDRVEKARPNTRLKRVVATNIKEYFPPALRLLFGLVREKKEGHALSLKGKDAMWFQDLLASGSSDPVRSGLSANDTACLLYTGGTTGVPKGAELTHRNLWANALATQAWCQAREANETVVSALPLFHSYGMSTCMNFSVVSSSAMLLMPNPRDLHSILLAIQKYRPTLFPGVPTMYVAFNNYPDIDKWDLKSIRACISGAAGLPVEVQTRFQQITGATLVEGYGLSEASPVTHANPIHGVNKIGTIGIPWPDTDARIVDLDTGEREMPVGEAGELIVRGPQVMKGYWNHPEETANALRDGWLYTGDIAKRDSDSYFAIVDRKKDMIISSGENIYPRDVEEVVYQHPKVKEVVVAGVPDAYRGEMCKAYIVLKEGATATEQEIIDWCRDGRIARFKVPRAIEFRTDLPKTMVGKVLRRVLVEEERKKLAIG